MSATTLPNPDLSWLAYAPHAGAEGPREDPAQLVVEEGSVEGGPAGRRGRNVDVVAGAVPASVGAAVAGTGRRGETERHPAAGRTYRHAIEVWDTVVTIDLRLSGGPGTAEFAAAEAAVRRACDAIRWTEGVFSPFRPESPASRLRSGEIEPEDLDPSRREGFALLYALERIRHGTEFTEGAFDPGASLGGLNLLGFVKGPASAQAADILEEAGFEDLCINAGGDVICRGEAEPGRPWSVGIRGASGAVVRAVPVSRGAVVEAGFMERESHIRDPWTGARATGAHVATVVGEDAGIAEVLSTGLVVAGRGGAGWFRDLEGWSAYVADPLPASTAWTVGF